MSKNQNNKNNTNSKNKPSKKSGGSRNKNMKQSSIGGFPTQSVPVARTTVVRPSGPRITHNGRTTTVVNQELVGGVRPANNNAFLLVLRLRVNPASKKTFPWLSHVAKAYETYRFKRLKFRYIPRCPTTAAGALILSPDYDAADRAPVSEIETAMNADAVELSFWQEKSCIFRPERMNAAYKQHYTADDDRFDQTAQDSKTIDAGQLFVVSSTADSTTAGRLWVEYEVDLFTPQVVTDLPSGGAGTNKNAGLNLGSANVFQDNSVAVNNEETEPIVSKLSNENFPGADLFVFNKDWKGFIGKEVIGTTVTGIGAVTKNGSTLPDVSIAGIINATATQGFIQYWGEFLKGDTVGSQPVSAATITNMIHNFGASSIL